MAIGRISGPLLKQNLERLGVDLAFETDLLYLNVENNNQKIGIKTTTPQYELDVNGTSRADNLHAVTAANLANFTIQGSSITNSSGDITLESVNGTVYQNSVTIDGIYINDNTITTNESNADLSLSANGTGVIKVFSDLVFEQDVTILGTTFLADIVVSGDVNANSLTTDQISIAGNLITTTESNADLELRANGTGRIYIANNNVEIDQGLTVGGTSNLNAVIVNGDITQTGDLTSSGDLNLTGRLTANSLDVDSIQFDNISINGNSIQTTQSNSDLDISANAAGIINLLSNTTVTGNIHATGNISADGNIIIGDDSTDAITINAEIASDIVPDIDDTYQLGNADQRWANIWVNEFNATNINTDNLAVDGIDLALRQGNIYYVAVNGDDARSGTHQNDPFLSVSKALSEAVAGDTVFIYPGIYTETFPLTVPAGVTVHGSGLRSVLIQPSVATQDKDAFLLNGETTVEDLAVGNFFYNSGNDTGYAFRFANGMFVSSRSPYIRNISVITQGSVTNASDPRGFNQGDAGKGALVDGSVVGSASKEASMLFHSVTFITPGVDALTATNGVRIEWLNSFSYFANRGIYAVDGVAGKYNDGKTRIKLGGTSGPFTPGNTITFTSTDSSTEYTATIESVNGDVITIDGYFDSLVGFDTTPQSITDGTATATEILHYDLRDFGAEIRLIASASVYGNYGLYGDGPGVLMYAVGHNLAYIGNGKEVTNDPTTVNQANEVVDLNNAIIRYNSVDHKGDFRVGDQFFVSQETGTVTFANADVSVEAINGLIVTNNGNTTSITATDIDVGNFNISGNTISTVSGDINLDAASDVVNINDNLNITGNLDVTGNINLNGNIVIGDEATDDLFINASIISNLVPAGEPDLGTPTEQWLNLYANNLHIDDIDIFTNVITTVTSNSDLELRASGTGRIYLPDNDLQIDNDLTVSGSTTLSNTTITGTVTHTGDYNQTGDTTVTGNVTVTGDLDVTGSAQFEEILIDDNFITTTTSNADLELRASGTGQILIPSNDVTITNNLTVNGTTNTADITSTGDITSNSFTTGDILVDDNFITTTQSNSNLELSANNNGVVLIPSNDVTVSTSLTVNGLTTLANTDVTGTITHVGDTNQTGTYTLTGDASVTGILTVDSSLQFEEILVNDNFITTTSTNADLELRAAGTGRVVIPDNDLIVSNDVTVQGTVTAEALSVTGITANSFSTGDILIDDNFITTTQSNSNLELRASGTGGIVVDEFTFNQNEITTVGDFTITPGSGLTVFNSTDAVVLPSGTTAERPTAANGMLRYNSELDRFEGYDGVNWLDLGKGVIDLDGDTRITAELTPGANDDTIRMYANGNLVADINANRFNTSRVEIDDISIDTNVIETITTNSDLVLSANGTGVVRIGHFAIENNRISNVVTDSITTFDAPNGGYYRINGSNGFVIPVGSNLNKPPANEAETGMMRYNTDDERVEVFDGVSFVSVAGAASGLDQNDAEELAIGIVLALG